MFSEIRGKKAAAKAKAAPAPGSAPPPPREHPHGVPLQLQEKMYCPSITIFQGTRVKVT